jgi:hypothetical protein
MFKRRKTDAPRTLTAAELVAEGMREMLANPGRRATDRVAVVRAQADERRKTEKQTAQPDLFGAKTG